MKISRKILTVIAGLAASLWTVHAQVATNLVSLTTFNPDSPSTWGYGYFYGNNGAGLNQYNRMFYLPEDTDLTNAMWQFTFDATDLVDVTGWGAGTGGPLHQSDPDPAKFVSPNRADYTLVFDARVDGLIEGQLNGNAEMQFSFFYPNDSGTAIKSLQINKGFQPTTVWKTFIVKLDEGGLGDNTSDADFELHHSHTTELRFNVNFHEPFRQFGYDGDNALYLDNVQLFVVNRPPVVNPTPTFPVTMLDWNMDDKGVWYEYHYEWSQNANHAVFVGGNNANGNIPNSLGLDGSSAWYLDMDNTSFVENTPAWAGGGSGGGGPVDYTKFDSGDLSKYRVSFSARADGLNLDRVETTTVLQLHMDSPDDTITPADEDANADFIIRLDFPITKLSSDWKPYSFLLSKAGVGGGSKEIFETYFHKISGLRTQWQIENAALFADWDFDNQNMFIVDNIKLERVYDGVSGLTFATEGEQLVLNWIAPTAGVTKLQSAVNIEGPFADVTDATSPYRTPMTGERKFFGLVWLQP